MSSAFVSGQLLGMLAELDGQEPSARLERIDHMEVVGAAKVNGGGIMDGSTWTLAGAMNEGDGFRIRLMHIVSNGPKLVAQNRVLHRQEAGKPKEAPAKPPAKPPDRGQDSPPVRQWPSGGRALFDNYLWVVRASWKEPDQKEERRLVVWQGRRENHPKGGVKPEARSLNTELQGPGGIQYHFAHIVRASKMDDPILFRVRASADLARWELSASTQSTVDEVLVRVLDAAGQIVSEAKHMKLGAQDTGRRALFERTIKHGERYLFEALSKGQRVHALLVSTLAERFRETKDLGAEGTGLPDKYAWTELREHLIRVLALR